MSDFICPICFDGENGEPARLHPCGDHRYHLRCLVKCFEAHRRCALCRRRGNSEADPGVIPAATYRHVTVVNWTCVLCLGNLVRYHNCYEINTCHHKLHVYCFNHMLMMYGMITSGGLYCSKCRSYM